MADQGRGVGQRKQKPGNREYEGSQHDYGLRSPGCIGLDLRMTHSLYKAWKRAVVVDLEKSKQSERVREGIKWRSAEFELGTC